MNINTEINDFQDVLNETHLRFVHTGVQEMWNQIFCPPDS